MNSKSVLVLTAVCAGLAYLGLQQQAPKAGATAAMETQPFDKLDLNAVTHVEIAKGKDVLTLSKKGEEWRAVQGELDYPIDFSKLVTFLRNVKKTELLAPYANDKSFDDKFGLDEASAPSILTLKNGDKIVLRCELGKGRISSNAAPNPYGFPPPEVGQFLRFGSTASVYMAKDKLEAETSSSSWIKSELVKADKDEITHIELGYPDKQMIWDKHVDKIQKSTDNSVPPETITNWVLTGDLANVEVNASEVSSWLDNLKEIRVSEPVASNKSSQILPEQSLHLKVVRGDKALYEISTQKIGNEWLIWSNDKPKEIYKASSYVLEGIFAHNDKLLKLPKPKIEGEASGLAWANNGSAFDLQKIVATWSLKSNGEQPKVKEDELKKVLDELKDLSAIDVLPKFKGKVAQSLTISANTTVVIEDLGKTELKDAHVVLIGDQVLALTSSSYDKLFPATNKLLDIPKPVAKNEDLTAFDNGVVKAEFKDKTWQLQDGRHLRTEAVDAWINSLNSLVESTYVPAMPSFTSKVHMSAKLAGADFQLDLGEAAKGLVPVRLSPYAGVFMVDLNVVRTLQNDEAYFVEKAPEKVVDASEKSDSGAKTSTGNLETVNESSVKTP